MSQVYGEKVTPRKMTVGAHLKMPNSAKNVTEEFQTGSMKTPNPTFVGGVGANRGDDVISQANTENMKIEVTKSIG